MIEVTSLSKVYGKKSTVFKALDEVSFHIPDGSTAAIIGKSGSGKSTLMHIMSGLDRATRGSVSISKRHVQSLSQKEVDKFRARDMSFIFQAFFVEPNQTCYQNVMLPLEIAKVSRRKRKQMVLDALKAVELSEKVNSRARDLSGGQKQRLAIARAIVNKPKLIFADEPTGNLDSVTGENIINLLFNLNKTLGSTLIIVTHDTELARRCQMQILLKDGRVDRIHVGVIVAKPVKPLSPAPQRQPAPLKPTSPAQKVRPMTIKPGNAKSSIGGGHSKKGVRYVS